jgi:hypothetical protein
MIWAEGCGVKMRLYEITTALILSSLALWFVQPIMPESWRSWAKFAFKIAFGALVFAVLGIYFVLKGESPVDTANRYVFCPLFPKSQVCQADIVAPPLPPPPNNSDDESFQVSKLENTIESYRAYVYAFPGGKHSNEAFAQINKLLQLQQKAQPLPEDKVALPAQPTPEVNAPPPAPPPRIIEAPPPPPTKPKIPSVRHVAIANKCSGGTQICDPMFEVDIRANSKISVDFSSGRPCSSIRLHFYLDGELVATSSWLGWPDATRNGATLPMSINGLDLGAIDEGTYKLAAQGEGRLGGCNKGELGFWSGDLTVHTYR